MRYYNGQKLAFLKRWVLFANCNVAENPGLYCWSLQWNYVHHFGRFVGPIRSKPAAVSLEPENSSNLYAGGSDIANELTSG